MVTCRDVSGWWLVSYGILWLAVAALGVLVVALAREVGALHLRLGPRGALEIDAEGPELGSVVPPLRGMTLDGREVPLGGDGALRLYLFASPTCSICDNVVPAMRVLADGRIEGVIVADAPPAELSGWAPRGVPVVSAPEAFVAYEIPGTPHAVVLDERGAVLAKGTPNDPTQLEGLLDTASRRARGLVRVP